MTDTKYVSVPVELFREAIEMLDEDRNHMSLVDEMRSALSAIEADRNKRASVGSLTDDDLLRIADDQVLGVFDDATGAFRVYLQPGTDIAHVVIAFARALLSSVAPRVPEGFVLVPKEQIERALDVVQDTMQAAYQNGYQVCCGRMGEECCGAPDTDWSSADHRIMDALSPAQRELSALLAAAPQPTQEG